MIQQNIVLTGFMGTGKTTVGKILARRLGRLFLDTDALVEQMANLSVPEIFARHGETCFRECESTALDSLKCYPAGSLVVATGGGAVLRDENRKAMRLIGAVVLLTASPKAIVRRVSGGADRPLLAGPRSPAEIVLNMLLLREPYYSECHLKIDTTGKKPSRIAGEIIDLLSSGEEDRR